MGQIRGIREWGRRSLVKIWLLENDGTININNKVKKLKRKDKAIGKNQYGLENWEVWSLLEWKPRLSQVVLALSN